MDTKKYICDLRNSDFEEGATVPSIYAEHPGISMKSIENHYSVPSVPRGRVLVTIENVSPELHGLIMQVPGVELYDA